MLLDVGARELVEVRRLAQADLLGLLLGLFDCPAVAQHAADHPEGADADGARTVDEGGAVRLVVRQFEELRGLPLLRLAVDDGDVEVAQAEPLRLRPLLLGAVLARRAQVDDGPDALLLQLRQVLVARLAARAELPVDPQAVAYRRRLLRRGRSA